VFVGGNEEITVYADPGTIRRKGDLVKIWQLFDRISARDSVFSSRA
jgi:hypothetical protein